MTVYLIPAGRDNYELYCEEAAPADVAAAAPSPSGFFERLRQSFSSILREAEQQRLRGETTPPAGAGWLARMRHRALAWVAERVAEQRLLWNLRSADAAVVVHPDDMTFADVDALVRGMLQRDDDRHRRWMYIDGTLFVVTFVVLGPLFLLIPGVANIPALYFGFRTVGHFLSARGAAQGLHRTRWSGRASPPLTELRSLAGVERTARGERLRAIAIQLSLPHLPVFFDRVVP